MPQNKKTIDMNAIKVGDVIEFHDYANDNMVQLAKVDCKFKDDYGLITVTTELSNDKITCREILQVYKQ